MPSVASPGAFWGVLACWYIFPAREFQHTLIASGHLGYADCPPHIIAPDAMSGSDMTEAVAVRVCGEAALGAVFVRSH